MATYRLKAGPGFLPADYIKDMRAAGKDKVRNMAYLLERIWGLPEAVGVRALMRTCHVYFEDAEAVIEDDCLVLRTAVGQRPWEPSLEELCDVE